MSALLINIKIDNESRFENFKITFKDISNHFDNAYVKFRGDYAEKCLTFFTNNYQGSAYFYQNIQSDDWIESVIEMIDDIKDRSIFIFIEDHRIVSKNHFSDVLSDFDAEELDNLTYSFFDNSSLKCENLLPLAPDYCNNFDTFLMTKNNKALLAAISPTYTVFSLASINSLNYLRMVLYRFRGMKKIYNKYLSYIFMRFIAYPRYRVLVIKINNLLRKFKVVFQLYPVDSPHNTEMLIDDYIDNDNEWKMGLLHKELFADSDDDNGHYGSSLMKRGLYPYNNDIPSHDFNSYVTIKRLLNKGQSIEYKYNSPVHRVYKAPVLELFVNKGEIEVSYTNHKDKLSKGMSQQYQINKGINVTCLESSVITFKLYDESFKNVTVN